MDIELYRLVKNGIIKRLAAGVFMNLVAGIRVPAPVEIARIKAARFGKRIVECCNSVSGNDGRIFHTDGTRTSFRTVHGRLHLKHLAPGKFKRQAAQSNTDLAAQYARPVTENKSLEFFDYSEPGLASEKLEQAVLLACRLARLVLRLLANRQHSNSP